MNASNDTARERIARLIDVASGRRPADLVIQHVNLVNVFDGGIEEDVDIAFSGSQIAGIGRYDGVSVVDAKGCYAAPSFIDGHMHIESTMVVPAEFAKVALACGTGCVIADPHEIANVAGVRGIRFMLEATRTSPLDFYFMLPSCVPATHLETNGETLDADRLSELRRNPRVLGLAEFMNYPGILFKDPDVLDKLAAFEGQLIDGHAPFLSGRDLEAYIAVGISTDHECTTPDEAREKLSRGMWIMMREGSVTRDVQALLPLLTPENMHRIMLATDDRHPSDLVSEGHINFAVNLLLQAGISLPTAVRLASLNPATHFRLGGKGAIAPGYWADLILFPDPTRVQPTATYAKGQLVAQDGVYTGPENNGHLTRTYSIKNSINIATPTYESLRVKPEPGKQLRVLQLIPHQVVTGERRVAPLVGPDGLVQSDPANDVLKIAVFERHHATGRVGVAFVSGFAMKQGAMASSVAHDSHNIVACGVSDRDILLAVQQVAFIGGGIAVANAGQVVGSLALPYGGLMSELSVAEVAQRLDALGTAMREVTGCPLDDPFMTLAFMALPVIPKLKVTDFGLVDVEKFKVVSSFI
ncbi:MAG TPA: adenine deaminase [Candidatus Cryosericum sp.]|nr:adenine deaminase [Candidatus Cryosericum sp.]